MALVGYVLLSYISLGREILKESDDDDEEGKGPMPKGADESLWVLPTPRNQLAVAIVFAILGAYGGNLFAGIISMKLRHPLIPMETLICNGLFGLMGLTLSVMKLRDDKWGDSLILRGFAINFCGAASLFARHASDNRRLYSKKGTSGFRRAVINMTANIAFASVVFWVAFEIIEWEHRDDADHHSRGVVLKIMKILETRRADRARHAAQIE